MSFSDELSNSILLNECATLKWLEDSDIPTPQLHAYGLRNDDSNKAGVAYMLIDNMEGRPLLHMGPSDTQTRQVYETLASVLSELAKRPLDRIGSLTLMPGGGTCIGPVIGDRTGTLGLLGAFDSGKSYYVAWCEEHLKLIADHQLFVRFPINAYLIFSFLKLQAEKGLWSTVDEVCDAAPFFLKHMDDKGDHILVDDNYNVTGIIDWTFARAVPSYEAFGPSLVTADMNDMYSGKVRRTDHDEMLASELRKHDPNITRFATSPDKIRRLTFSFGSGVDLSWDEALELFKGIMQVFGQGNFDWDSWSRKALTEFEKDTRLHSLVSAIKDNPMLVLGDRDSRV
ncbi:MAG: hypothetical protein M1820_002318 [Bogoriella megaspora]|nr:MAG: hypothetical protein M1820_002318 [Bogoriella megaspora]